MKPLTKVFIWTSVIAALLGLYFASNIKGYYRFKEICRKDSGLTLIQKIQAGQGWLVSNEYDRAPFTYSQVAFLRYQSDKDGKTYDIHRADRKRVEDPQYVIKPADLTKQVKYKYQFSSGKIAKENGVWFDLKEIIDLDTNRLQLQYITYTYKLFDPDETIFGFTIPYSCPEGAEVRTIDSVGIQSQNARERSISSNFISQ
jgi:hypothetical protein